VLPAVIVSSSLGIILLVAVTLTAQTPWPSLPSVAGTPWWGWLGGPLGAIYAVTTVLVARELGAATLTALVVTGQLVCSVVLDHFGWVGFTEHAAGIGRVLGVSAHGSRVLLDRAFLRAATAPGGRGDARPQ
jgi:transporter family-2 protein